MERFSDRHHAGRVLAGPLARIPFGRPPAILALPRGGVPVAYEIAKVIGAPLDVFVVRKLGAPGQPELAMGAIAHGGVRVINEEVVEELGVPAEEIDRVAREEAAELERRERAYRGDAPAVNVRGRTAILVDDGLATGSTMLAAIAALREMAPAKIVVAVPVGAAQTCRKVAAEVDMLVCPIQAERFWAVGHWYEDFGQTTDEEVRALLDAAKHEALERGLEGAPA